MSKIKPFEPDEILDAVTGTLVSEKSPDKLQSVKEIFQEEGADIQAAARAAFLVMNRAEKDADRLRAAELILKIQGAYVPDEIKSPPGITINIINGQGTQNNLVNLVMPLV